MENKVVQLAGLLRTARGTLDAFQQDSLNGGAQLVQKLQAEGRLEPETLRGSLQLIRVVAAVKGALSEQVDRPEGFSGTDFGTSEEYSALVLPLSILNVEEKISKLLENLAFALWDVRVRSLRIEQILAEVDVSPQSSPETIALLIRFARPMAELKKTIDAHSAGLQPSSVPTAAHQIPVQGPSTGAAISTPDLSAQGSAAGNAWKSAAVPVGASVFSSAPPPVDLSPAELQNVRVERSIHLKVAEAKELKAMDMNGFSDPFVVVRMDDREVARTPTLYKNLNPSWLEEYDFNVEPADTQLTMEVFDWDRIGSNDRIGRVVITTEEMEKTKNLERWFPLEKSSGKYHVEGDIGVKGQWFPGGANILQSGGTFKITLENARGVKSADLNGLSDPYCVLKIGDSFKKKTKVVKKTLNPDWNEMFEFHLDQTLVASRASVTVDFEVFDWDRVGKNDFLGLVSLPLSSFIPDPAASSQFAARYRLQPPAIPAEKRKERGKLRANIHFIQHTVLPLHCYDRLGYMLRANDFDLAVRLGQASGASGEVMTALMRFFCTRDDDIRFLRRVIRDEVQATPDPGTIFRGNSVASKSLDAYQKILSSKLLVDTIKPIVDQIYAGAKGKKDTIFFELDETRPDGANGAAQTNLATLLDFTTRTWTAIQATEKSIPDALRVVYAIIRENVVAHFGNADGVETVTYTAPSGFLFLRFFCPAILGPMSYGVSDIHAPSEAASRNLTLLSKTMMNLGNLVEFGQKEPFMHPVNPFIQREIPKMRAFLDQVCQFPASVESNAGAQDSVERTYSELLAADRCAARIAAFATELLPKVDGVPDAFEAELQRIYHLQPTHDHNAC